MSDASFKIDWSKERNGPRSRTAPELNIPPRRILSIVLVIVALFILTCWASTWNWGGGSSRSGGSQNPVRLQLQDAAAAHREAASRCRSGEIDSMLTYEAFVIEANKQSKRSRFGYRSEVLDKFNTEDSWNGDAVADIAESIAKEYDDAVN